MGLVDRVGRSVALQTHPDPDEACMSVDDERLKLESGMGEISLRWRDASLRSVALGPA